MEEHPGARRSWWRVCALGAMLALALALAAPAAVSAGRSAARYGISIQAAFDHRGNPLVVANFTPDGSLARPAWSICAPARPCHPGRAIHGLLAPGPEPAGTRLIASATYRGHRYRAVVRWRGPVRAISPPSMGGSPHTGGVLIPRPAGWTGGWGGETDQLGVEACATPTGQRCAMLGGGELGCPDQSSRPRLGSWFTGDYVFALDARLPRDLACAGTGYATNPGLPLWRLGATVVRSGALGPITGTPRPRYRFLTRAQVRDGRLEVAAVQCASPCAVAVSVTDGPVGSSARLTVTGRRLVGVPARGLPAGRLTIDLRISDGPDLTGASRR